MILRTARRRFLLNRPLRLQADNLAAGAFVLPAGDAGTSVCAAMLSVCVTVTSVSVSVLPVCIAVTSVSVSVLPVRTAAVLTVCPALPCVCPAVLPVCAFSVRAAVLFRTVLPADGSHRYPCEASCTR